MAVYGDPARKKGNPMSENIRRDIQKEFGEEVYTGLTAPQKHLSSAFFYDETGDILFQKIMDLNEYYLTGCEFEILNNHKKIIGELFSAPDGFDLFELGAGDAKKTKILLRQLLEAGVDFTYHPIDISNHALNELSENLEKELPQLKISPLQGTYFGTLDQLGTFRNRKKVILFLGSNIGNLSPDTAVSLLQRVRAGMEREDLLFIGMDQKKDPAIILKAYNDPQGVTAAFNINILARINRELGGNFNVEGFKHWALYNPQSGEARSYLISQEEQEVEIKALGLKLQFRKWESIHTEISRKFDDAGVAEMAEDSGLKLSGSFSDERGYFRNYILQKA